MNFMKRLFCRHAFEFVRNLYGDQIRDWGWKRSVWACSKCGKLKAMDHLVKKETTHEQ